MRRTTCPLIGLLVYVAARWLTACTTPAPDTPYATCTSGDTCTGSTTCETTELTSGTGAGFLCAASCAVSTDCPADPNGSTVDCIVNVGETMGQCYVDCGSNANACEYGTVCTPFAGVTICVP